MKTNESNSKKTVKLCGVQGCCPEVEFDHEAKIATIKDDYNGSVKLTFDQLKDLTGKVAEEKIN